MSLLKDDNSNQKINNDSDEITNLSVLHNGGASDLELSSYTSYSVQQLNEVFDIWRIDKMRPIETCKSSQNILTMFASEVMNDREETHEFNCYERRSKSCDNIADLRYSQVKLNSPNIEIPMQSTSGVKKRKSKSSQSKTKVKDAEVEMNCLGITAENSESFENIANCSNSKDEDNPLPETGKKKKKQKKTKKNKSIIAEESLKLFECVSPDLAERMDALCDMLALCDMSPSEDLDALDALLEITEECSGKNNKDDVRKSLKKLNKLVKKEKRKEENHEKSERSKKLASRGDKRKSTKLAKGSPQQNTPKTGNKITEPYEEFWSPEQVREGIMNGTVIEGAVRINPKRYTEAFVSSPSGGQDIFIQGLHDRNRALEGDLVAVYLKDPSEWKIRSKEATKSKIDLDSSKMDEEEQIECIDDSFIEHDVPEKPQVTGKVIAILAKQHPRRCAGNLKLLMPNDKNAVFSPRDNRIPRMKIPLKKCPSDFVSDPASKINVLYLVKMLDWSSGKFALGEIIEEIGESGDIVAETKAILSDNDLDVSPLHPELYEEFLIHSKEPFDFQGREDLRKECIFTIDPSTAKDLDDAVSCRELENGNLEIGVHISDVTFYLKEGTDLDNEVSKRATSVYLVDRVHHMLPVEMCLQCSLLPGQDKAAYSVFWEISKNEAEILSQRIVRSVINSCAKLSYNHAQVMIENPVEELKDDEFPEIKNGYSLSDISKVVNNLQLIAQKLRRQRFHNGALRIDQTKLFIQLDSNGIPVKVDEYINMECHRLIEEFMLLANMTIAKFIYDKFPDIAFLRCHPEPFQHLLEELQEALATRGIHLSVTSAGALQTSLTRYSGDDIFSRTRLMVLNLLCSKTMARAKYFCAGRVEEKDFSHYSLSVPFYTHFTSPIRRYADVMVHRLLNAAMGYCPKPLWSEEYVSGIAANCNKKKYSAKLCGEQSIKLYLSLFIKNNQPILEDAVVINVKDYSFDVIICRYGLTLRVYVKKLDADILCNPEQKNSPMKIVWKPNNVNSQSQEQIIDVFSLVKVNLYCENLLKVEAKLSRPENNPEAVLT